MKLPDLFPSIVGEQTGKIVFPLFGSGQLCRLGFGIQRVLPFLRLHIYFSNVHINMIQMGGTIFENIVRPNAERSQLSEEPGTDGWVNIEPVVFKNSDLSTAIFEACNLSNVELRNYNIEGLSIDGILVKDLLERYKGKGEIDIYFTYLFR
jgi:hypothetical protein